MRDGRLVLHKAWRSEVERIAVFFVLCVAAVALSWHFPGSIIRGEVISFGDTQLFLKLPLFSLMPFISFGDLISRVYDVCYILDSKGVEARSGIVSFRRHMTQVRYEDIRLVEIDQSLMDRFLDVGLVKVDTAATGKVEIMMQGVVAPKEVQRMVQAERDKRQQLDELGHKDIESQNKAVA